jgi:hypothetical protein
MWGQPPRLSGQAQPDLQLPALSPREIFLVNRQTTPDLTDLYDSMANIFLQKCPNYPLLCDIITA